MKELSVTVNGQVQLTAELETLDWDSEILGIPVGRLGRFNVLPDAKKHSTELFKQIETKLQESQLQYITVRVPQSEWWMIQGFETVGLQTVDTVVEFGKELDLSVPANKRLQPPKLPSGYGLRPAMAADADAVAQLSVKTFNMSRFHNDPILTRTQADKLHFEWAKNCCLGEQADQVWLITTKHEIVGFVTNKLKGKTGMIGLIGISGGEAGRGFGKVLMQQSESWFSACDCQEISVQTQGNNYAAMALYTKCGFRIRLTQHTLRWSAK
jgi:dTDP-4-amino-4,6-dideoxy-D-galactose acyltransferase